MRRQAVGGKTKQNRGKYVNCNVGLLDIIILILRRRDFDLEYIMYYVLYEWLSLDVIKKTATPPLSGQDLRQVAGKIRVGTFFRVTISLLKMNSFY